MGELIKQIISTSVEPLPLTYFGNPGAKQRASPGRSKAEMVGSKVKKLVSEIYV